MLSRRADESLDLWGVSCDPDVIMSLSQSAQEAVNLHPQCCDVVTSFSGLAYQGLAISR